MIVGVMIAGTGSVFLLLTTLGFVACVRYFGLRQELKKLRKLNGRQEIDEAA